MTMAVDCKPCELNFLVLHHHIFNKPESSIDRAEAEKDVLHCQVAKLTKELGTNRLIDQGPIIRILDEFYLKYRNICTVISLEEKKLTTTYLRECLKILKQGAAEHLKMRKTSPFLPPSYCTWFENRYHQMKNEWSHKISEDSRDISKCSIKDVSREEILELQMRLCDLLELIGFMTNVQWCKLKNNGKSNHGTYNRTELCKTRASFNRLIALVLKLEDLATRLAVENATVKNMFEKTWRMLTVLEQFWNDFR